jgi:hypothetical protein
MTPESWVMLVGSLSMVLSIISLVSVRRLERRMDRSAQRAVFPDLTIRKFTLPAFGDPEKIRYRSAEYENPLRCAGKTCGNRELVDGELFFQIPLPNQGDGAILPICLPCGSQEVVGGTGDNDSE